MSCCSLALLLRLALVIGSLRLDAPVDLLCFGTGIGDGLGFSVSSWPSVSCPVALRKCVRLDRVLSLRGFKTSYYSGGFNSVLRATDVSSIFFGHAVAHPVMHLSALSALGVQTLRFCTHRIYHTDNASERV